MFKASHKTLLFLEFLLSNVLIIQIISLSNFHFGSISFSAK